MNSNTSQLSSSVRYNHQGERVIAPSGVFVEMISQIMCHQLQNISSDLSVQHIVAVRCDTYTFQGEVETTAEMSRTPCFLD